MLLVTILVFMVLILLLVLVHELGHFAAAKLAGCRVEEFAFGFPPRLFSVVKGGTRYVFNLLPIGGYVKIQGEDMEEENPSPDSFAGKSIPWRVIILAAGVFMNMVLAVVLLSIQAGAGVPVLVTEENQSRVTGMRTHIVEVVAGSPAETAGILALDTVEAINLIEKPTIDQLVHEVDGARGAEVTLKLSRGHEIREIKVVPRENPPAEEGAMGVGLEETGLLKATWWKAPGEGLKRTWQMTGLIATEFAKIIGRLASGGGGGAELGGPIAIAVYTDVAAKLGFSYVLEWGALISINLALINILPFPALDGGRILFVLIEAIFGRKVPGKWEYWAHTGGFVLLIALVLLVTYHDVMRFVF